MKIRLETARAFPSVHTSITDISFLLTIFFVVAAVFIADIGIFLSLPRADAPARQLTPAEAVSLRIEAAGGATAAWDVVVEGTRVAAVAGAVAEAVRAALPTKRSPVAVIAVGRGVPYQRVLDVVAEVKEAGVDTFSIGAAAP